MRMENSCHSDMSLHPNFHRVRALFQDSCTLLAPVGSLNLKNRQQKIAHLFLPPLSNCLSFDSFLLLLCSLCLLFLRRRSAPAGLAKALHQSERLGSIPLLPSPAKNLKVNEMQNNSEVMELLHYGGDST